MKHLALLLPLLLLLLTSCQPTIPSEYLQPDEMEDVLYDYQLALALGNQMDQKGNMPTDVDKNVYKMAALKKHGLTEKQFDHSLQYYLRHTEKLHKIYENLAERLSNDAVALGTSISDINDYGNAQQGDTANVWNKASAFILSTDEGLNQETFTIKADTAYHKGDRLMLTMDTQFIVQDGSRDAVAIMAVTLANDSIVNQTCRLTTNGHNTLTFSDNGRVGIKQVRGYFIFNRSDNDSQTTLKLLNIYNVKLVRMHTQEATTPQTDETDQKIGSQDPIR